MCTSGYILVRAGERARACAQKCADVGVLHIYVCVGVGVGSCICKCMCKHVQTRVGVCEGAYMRAHLRMRGRMSACAGGRASDNFIHKINYIYVF